MKRKCIILSIVMIACFLLPVRSEAAEKTGRLRETLENDSLFHTETIASINKTAGNFSDLKKEYDNSCIALSGRLGENAVSENFKMIVLFDSNGVDRINVDTSEKNLLQDVKGISPGDLVTVFGRMKVNSFNRNFSLQAHKLIIKPREALTPNQYCFEDGAIYKSIVVSDVSYKQDIRLSFPERWYDNRLFTRLKNNGINGYQFFLNAIAENKEHPEVFYIFYFNYETYLDTPPVNPSDRDYKAIEKRIIENILKEDVDKTFWDRLSPQMTISTVTCSNGEKLDYYMTTAPISGSDYRLEFVFKRGLEGMVCSLYLYFPQEGAVKFTRDVAFVLESIDWQ